MTSFDRKELMNDALLYTAGAVAISMASKKLLKQPLGTPNTVESMVKLGGAVVGGTILVKYLQSKKYLPVKPFA